MSPLGIFICLPKVCCRSCEPAWLPLPQWGNISWEFLRSWADSLLPLQSQAVKCEQREPLCWVNTSHCQPRSTDWLLALVRVSHKGGQALKVWLWALEMLRVCAECPAARCLSSRSSCRSRGHPGRDAAATLSEMTLCDAWDAPYGCPGLICTAPPKMFPTSPAQRVRRQHKTSAAAQGGALWRAQCRGRGTCGRSALATGRAGECTWAYLGDFFWAGCDSQLPSLCLGRCTSPAW